MPCRPQKVIEIEVYVELQLLPYREHSPVPLDRPHINILCGRKIENFLMLQHLVHIFIAEFGKNMFLQFKINTFLYLLGLASFFTSQPVG
jgi:hypothetical protein